MLSRVGIVYDPSRRRLHHTREELSHLKNWGSLRDGREYDITVASLDIVGNSVLVRENGARTMEKLYFELWKFIEHKLDDFDGRMWNWAGDGGLLAFTFPGHADRAAMCAIDTGRFTFHSDTGRIVAETINHAAHLEKSGTEPGCVSLSERAIEQCNARILSIFTRTGEFEGSSFRSTTRIDALFGTAVGCVDFEPTRN